MDEILVIIRTIESDFERFKFLLFFDLEKSKSVIDFNSIKKRLEELEDLIKNL